jgi:hypothetical protein
MKRSLLLLGLICIFASAQAQTQLFFEDFEAGVGQFILNTTDLGGTTSGTNEWVVNNSYTGGPFTLPCGLGSGTMPATASQPGGISSANGNYAHMVSLDAAAAGVTNANFIASDGGLFCVSDESNFMRMTGDINTTSLTSVTIDFWWLCSGSGSNYGELYFSTNGGASWTKETTVPKYFNQVSWQNQTISNPAWDNQSQLRFAFRFVNQLTFSASDPGFGVDDIEVVGTAACVNSSSSFAVTACDSYTVPSGDETYSTPGTAMVMDTIQNAGGCDSIMTINVTIRRSSSETIKTEACGSYTVPSGNRTVSSSGTVLDTIQNSIGCDSLLTIVVTIFQASSSSFSIDTCGHYTVPSGNQTVTTSGMVMDTIPNEDGCDSIMTISVTIRASSTSSFSVDACQSYTLPSGKIVSASGTVLDTIPNAETCDSIMTINITINSLPDIGVTNSNPTLTANQNGASYQWLDCDKGNLPIAGDTNQSFTATASGNFAVVVSLNGCVDTSECVQVTTVGIEDNEKMGLTIYPNPVSDKLWLETDGSVTEVEVIDLNGKLIFTSKVNSNRESLDLAQLPAGFYIVHVINQDGHRDSKRFVKR